MRSCHHRLQLSSPYRKRKILNLWTSVHCQACRFTWQRQLDLYAQAAICPCLRFSIPPCLMQKEIARLFRQRAIGLPWHHLATSLKLAFAIAGRAQSCSMSRRQSQQFWVHHGRDDTRSSHVASGNQASSMGLRPASPACQYNANNRISAGMKAP
jgi:hypothetical protein